MSDIAETLSEMEQRIADYIKENYDIALTRGGVMNVLSLGRAYRMERGDDPFSMSMRFDEQDAKAALDWVDSAQAKDSLREMFGAKKDDEDE